MRRAGSGGEGRVGRGVHGADHGYFINSLHSLHTTRALGCSTHSFSSLHTTSVSLFANKFTVVFAEVSSPVLENV